MDDIANIISNIQKKKNKEEECSVHIGTPLNYFCETCSEAICADCAMFSKEHKSHEFLKIS